MIPCCYLRSSSYNQYDWCEQSAYLGYTLGFPANSNQRADIGNIVHKALELLAQRKYAEQKKASYFIDEDFGKLKTKCVSPSVASHLAYMHYAKVRTHHSWDQEKFRETDELMWKILDFNGGMYNPLNLNILEVEKFFDFTINEDWADYHYKIKGQDVKGKLGLKGHIDLITKVDDKTLEIIDYKTGQKKDWGSGKAKNDDNLYKDPQLRMYHYAAHELYPEIDVVLLTIYYIRFNWMSTITFDKSDIKDTKEMVRRRFERIKRIKVPQLIINVPHLKWKCHKLCEYNKPDDNNNTVCNKIHQEILDLGIERVTDKYVDINKLREYGSGGGQL